MMDEGVGDDISIPKPGDETDIDPPVDDGDDDAAIEQQQQPLLVPLLFSPRPRQEQPHHGATATNAHRRRRRPLPRLLDRDADFSQSRGRWNVQHAGQENARRHTSRIRRIWDHWFYTVSYQRTPVLMVTLFVTYTLLVVLYAAIYLGISRIGQALGEDQNEDNTADEEKDGKTTTFCNMGISTFMEAMYFSLSTMTTIGYGVSDYYFGGCWAPLVMVLWQVCTAVTFDAIAVGLLYQRFSRGHKRRKTIVLSNECVVLRVHGKLHWMVRIAELRRRATLLNASVRAYCVYHDRRRRHSTIITNGDGANNVETTHFVTRPVRLQHQAVHDNLLLNLPQVVCHVMDDASPLRPSSTTAGDSSSSCSWLDARGEARPIPPPNVYCADVESIRAYWLDRNMEVIVIVEGTDELTGACIEARHSYTVDDVAWNHSFAPCTDATATVDFARIHETVPAALDHPEGHAYVFSYCSV